MGGLKPPKAQKHPRRRRCCIYITVIVKISNVLLSKFVFLYIFFSFLLRFYTWSPDMSFLVCLICMNAEVWTQEFIVWQGNAPDHFLAELVTSWNLLRSPGNSPQQRNNPGRVHLSLLIKFICSWNRSRLTKQQKCDKTQDGSLWRCRAAVAPSSFSAPTCRHE